MTGTWEFVIVICLSLHMFLIFYFLKVKKIGLGWKPLDLPRNFGDLVEIALTPLSLRGFLLVEHAGISLQFTLHRLLDQIK